MAHEYSSRHRIRSAATLLGSRVRNPAGDGLGKIEDLMVDVATGRVTYAIIAFGGILGVGDKLFPAPWRALTFNERTHECILHVGREQFEQTPGIDPDQWPDMTDPSWDAQVEEFYGMRESEPANS